MRLNLNYKLIKLKHLIIDEAVQPREMLNSAKVDEYAKCYEEGVILPPPVVHEINSDLYLCDGFTRVAGAVKAGVKQLKFLYFPDSTRQKLLTDAVKCNSKHGQPLTSQERKNAVIRLATIARDNNYHWTQTELAKVTGFSQAQVSRLLKAHFGDNQPKEKEIDMSVYMALTQKGVDEREERDRKNAELRSLPDDASETHKNVYQDMARTIVHTNRIIWHLKELTWRMRIAKDMPCGTEIRNQYARLEDARVCLMEINSLRPHCVCSTCLGKGCESCRHRGWITNGEHRGHF